MYGSRSDGLADVPPPQDTMDDDEEVMYDSCCDSQNGDGEPDPFDDIGWLEGPPARTIAKAMLLSEQCWSADYMLAEFLTEGEVVGEIARNAAPLASASASALLLEASSWLRERPEKIVVETSRLSVALRGVSAAAVGHGCRDAAEWRHNVRALVSEGAVAVFVHAFNEISGPILPVAKQVFAGEQDADGPEVVGPTLALRAVLNGLAGLLLGSGSGEPHNTQHAAATGEGEQHLPVHEGLDGLLMQLFMLIRDAPAAPSILPGKKLVILSHVVLTSLCGPIDITPASWRDGTQRSMRWVGDGATEQYIASVLQSGSSASAGPQGYQNKNVLQSTSCSRLQFLTADQLRGCHYRFYTVAMRQLMEGSDCASGPEMAVKHVDPADTSIPLPVREALAVFAVQLARAQIKRRDTRLTPQADLDAAMPDVSSASIADVCGMDSAAHPLNLHINDIREPSLAPEYPPRGDDHLVPEGMMSTGTPSPAVWHGLAQHTHRKREDTDIGTSGELLFRMLYSVLPGFVVGVFKLFLSSLPGEDAARNSNRPVTEAAAFGATSQAEIARQRSITMKAVTGLLLHIVKLISRHSVIQAEMVLQAMADSNGLLLLLKYLHQNSVLLLTGVDNVAEGGWDEAIEVPCPLPAHEGAHVPWGDTAQDLEETLNNKCRSLVVLDGDMTHVIQCDSRNLIACTTVLRLIRKLVRRRPSRLALMLFYKMQILLRRKLRIVHPLMVFYGLKLLGDLNPHMGRKWRVQNTKSLSQLYRYATPTIPDVCACVFANAEPLDSSDIPVPQEQRDAEEYMQKVCQEYGHIEYPTLKPFS